MKNTSRFLVLAAALSAVASANALTITGSSTGVFTGGGTTLGGLTYTGGTFSAEVDPVSGFYAVGGNSLADSFGFVSLANTSFNYEGKTLDITINFTNPADTNPNGPVYSALLHGTVTNTSGGVNISFGSAPKVFTFDGGAQSFTLALDTLSITHGRAGYVTGSGEVTTPAPAAMAAFAVGAIGNLRRRRRNA